MRPNMASDTVANPTDVLIIVIITHSLVARWSTVSSSVPTLSCISFRLLYSEALLLFFWVTMINLASPKVGYQKTPYRYCLS